MASTTTSLPEFIASRRDEIESLCREFHVCRLELFGSAAVGRFDPQRSDLDFIIEFEPGFEPELKLDAYLGLKAELEQLFDRNVDVLFLSAVRNPFVRTEIERQRTPIYAL